MTLPAHVRIVEVGPRDGLQSEAATLPAHVRAALIDHLAGAGLVHIEAGSFVSPAAIPQMAGAAEVLALSARHSQLRLSVLVPNMIGLDAALKAGAREVAVFASASETFSQKNVHCSISKSIERYGDVVNAALRHGVLARGYVSCALGCPYEGDIDRRRVLSVARALSDIGCYQISLADTIGVGTPLRARRIVEHVAHDVPLERLAVHFHDTYGQALANIFACLEIGVATVDCSVAGLGGCPNAPGASGNVATEDVVYMLNGMGIESGVDLERLLGAGDFICRALRRTSSSRVARAFSVTLSGETRA
jgi:hydroxymethylglutaryl-CoA lyase